MTIVLLEEESAQCSVSPKMIAITMLNHQLVAEFLLCYVDLRLFKIETETHAETEHIKSDFCIYC